LINKNKGSLKLPSILAQMALLVMIFIGTKYPISLNGVFGENTIMFWIFFLMIYGFIASTLPVWMLLQPRDYINGHQLFLGLGLLITGLIISAPPIVAPMINPNPVGAPPWFPFLFITIACGAISGFHGLVSSGTTSKQVKNWKDARPIGYGSMLGEGLLAVLATLAVTAGFKTPSAWHSHYSSWGAANGLSAKIGAFVKGSGVFIEGIGIPAAYGETIMAVLIISFAATSLDTAIRIQRYIIGEIGEVSGVKPLKNRFIGAGIAVISAMLLMFMGTGGKGGLLLWPLFGATNQMLAGLTLIVICVYLVKKKRPAINFVIPAIFIICMTAISLFLNIKIYFQSSKWMLFVIGIILGLCQIWIITEGLLAIKQNKQTH
jgi:carbon starvation protein